MPAANGLAQGVANTILSSATATGPGQAWAVPLRAAGQFGRYTWQVIPTGTFTALTVTLEGSLDGATWFTLDTINSVTGGAASVSAAPVNFLRANVTTFTGGTNVSAMLTLGAA